MSWFKSAPVDNYARAKSIFSPHFREKYMQRKISAYMSPCGRYFDCSYRGDYEVIPWIREQGIIGKDGVVDAERFVPLFNEYHRDNESRVHVYGQKLYITQRYQTLSHIMVAIFQCPPGRKVRVGFYANDWYTKFESWFKPDDNSKRSNYKISDELEWRRNR